MCDTVTGTVRDIVIDDDLPLREFANKVAKSGALDIDLLGLLRAERERCSATENDKSGDRALHKNESSKAMRDVSPRDLIDNGGWASYDAPLKCYTRPDLEAQRAAFGKRRELRAPVRTDTPRSEVA